MSYSSTRLARRALACLLFLGACNATPRDDSQSQPGDVQSMDGGTADAGNCPPIPSSVSRSPSSISDAVALANGMLAGQSSLSIDCFIGALSRPMTVLGAVSTFSLQPSVGGSSNPRVFIFSGNLVLSVVPTGQGSQYVELAEFTTSLRSIKAQLGPFPLTEPVTAAAPYDAIREGGGTLCGDCHPGEMLAPQVTATEAFESNVLRPVSSAIVPLQKMQDDADGCDPTMDAERCAILNALFNHGAVVTGAFDPNAETFD